jgi:hypothetical protein
MCACLAVCSCRPAINVLTPCCPPPPPPRRRLGLRLQANFLLGKAHREQKNLPVAIKHLQRALDAAREKEDAIKGEEEGGHV